MDKTTMVTTTTTMMMMMRQMTPSKVVMGHFMMFLAT